MARFDVRLALVGALLLGSAAVALSFWRDGQREPHPNILIVLWDTARADRMSLYGHTQETTPALERIAEHAVVYDAAMSPGMWTVPSHGSLFTGLSTGSHGARVGWLWLDSHYTTLAEHLRDQGYATYAFSSNPYLSDETNLLQGFDAVSYSWKAPFDERCAEATRSKLLPLDRSTEISPAFVRSPHAEGWPEHLTLYKDAAPIITDALLSWIDERSARDDGAPFFAYLNLLEAHHPRIPTMEARRAVADEATIALSLSTDNSLMRTMSAMEGRASFTEQELLAMAATYDATLWELDRATGALVDGLDKRGILEDTLVVVVSDHGENLGENGMFDHRWDLHQTLVHVPLLVRYPKGMAPGRVKKPVSTSHLYGTLLSLAGLPLPEVDHPLPVLGEEQRVFSELEAPTPRLAEIRRAWPDLEPRRWDRRYGAIFEDNLKLQKDTAGWMALYDLAADPRESTDISASDPARTGELSEALARWNKSRPKYDPRLRTKSDRPGNPLKVDSSTREMLKALGYEEEEAP